MYIPRHPRCSPTYTQDTRTQTPRPATATTRLAQTDTSVTVVPEVSDASGAPLSLTAIEPTPAETPQLLSLNSPVGGLITVETDVD